VKNTLYQLVNLVDKPYRLVLLLLITHAGHGRRLLTCGVGATKHRVDAGQRPRILFRVRLATFFPTTIIITVSSHPTTPGQQAPPGQHAGRVAETGVLDQATDWAGKNGESNETIPYMG